MGRVIGFPGPQAKGGNDLSMKRLLIIMILLILSGCAVQEGYPVSTAPSPAGQGAGVETRQAATDDGQLFVFSWQKYLMGL